jgi:hypothetical protein
MYTLRKLALLSLLLVVVSVSYAFQLERPETQQNSVSPTPTYDPLAEPPLPPNPTEFELGRNLYWHWCMPCHGDQGQGLTDEFRGIWEADHQNCWGRGCHSGRPEDSGFPIPTLVPALVNFDQLARFSSLQDLIDYLRNTHPPQSPGSLRSEEYHAIALFVFTMNGRLPINTSPTASSAPVSSSTPVLSEEPIPASNSIYVAAFFIVIVLASIILILRTRKLKI